MTSFPLACRSQHQQDDARFPTVASRSSAYPVVLHPDEADVRRVVVRSLTVQEQRDGHVRETLAVRRGAVELLITDTRVVLTGSRPTADTLLAGHVLLDWVVAVGGSAGSGRFRDDALRVVMELDSGEYVVLTPTFDAGVDVHELAQDIARRTARRWLAREGSSPLSRRWEALAEAPRLAAPVGEFALHFTPTHTRVAAVFGGASRTGVPA